MAHAGNAVHADKHVLVVSGVSGADQEDLFPEATRQGGDGVVFSVATYIEVPAEVTAEGDVAVAHHLAGIFRALTMNGVRFEAYVGPEETT